MVGPTKDGDKLGVTRLGGHRENGETPWECVAREVLEEAAVHIRHMPPPATYVYKGDEVGLTLEQEEWRSDSIAPLVAAAGGGQITPLYLAEAEESPVPSSETQGLLFLTPCEIAEIATRPMTLQMHLDAGGHAALRPGFPVTLPMAPFYHIRLLHRLLSMHPQLR